jgi:hypothetical protein
LPATLLAKLRRTAADEGLDLTVHHSTIEQMDPGTTFRSIFLAGLRPPCREASTR